MTRLARYILVLAALVGSVAANAAGLTFTGNAHRALTADVPASSGLDALYVLDGTAGVTASYTARNGAVSWSRYSNLGGGYAEPVATTVSGNTYSITLGADDMGYIIDDGDRRYCYWVVNYANHALDLHDIAFAPDQDCDRARLQLIGNAAHITYYSVTGMPMTVGRDLTLEYNTLEYSEESERYVQIPVTATIDAIDGTFGVPAPLCDTEFTLSGDRFTKEWGMMQTVVSPYYQTPAVEAHTVAVQDIRENDNEQQVDGGALGGSGPVDVTFTAAVTDAAIFHEWLLSRDPEFETVDDRFTELEFSYSFRDNGTTYVRFVADNAAGTCMFVGDTYEVFVGESDLLCPNAFSPGASEGVNDEWKVSYKSLVSFECHIFNRWGQKMFSTTDPGKGWDGKYGGKVVPTGVYYYVIKAVGTDGRKYNRSGDINVVGSRTKTTGGTSDDVPAN